MYVITYIGGERPYTSMAMNVIEILNEIFVFMAAFPLLTFTEWVGDPEVRTTYGWVLVVLICANVAFNIIVAITVYIHGLYYKCKLRKIRKMKIEMAKNRIQKLQDQTQEIGQ